MRKKKDMEMTLVELKKQDELQEEIERKNEYLEQLTIKSKKIGDKVKAMKKFEDFLEKVMNQNPDEFTELQSIVTRYDSLLEKNIELHKTQKSTTIALDRKTKELVQYQKDMETEMISINNKMSGQQQNLEFIDS